MSPLGKNFEQQVMAASQSIFVTTQQVNPVRDPAAVRDNLEDSGLGPTRACSQCEAIATFRTLPVAGVPAGGAEN